ncbi:MAG: GntR family transcriptional regulator [Candidatus Methanomethylophilaceae archaeon]|nr:GntR family transcriptional regulator [Candidatus Methanomethylophilaceae archaeon]MBR4181418.1 GntR family transcriptional regulator [Candidatus Methanomethylophilaceae archaeon]
MDLIITTSSGKPIYEQLKEQIKDKIISGELEPGYALPSMRDLAKELKVSLITTKRAYQDLESEGFIVSSVGKGSFVSSTDIRLLQEYKLKEMEDSLRRAVRQAKVCKVGLDEIQEVLSMIYKEEERWRRAYRSDGSGNHSGGSDWTAWRRRCPGGM